MIKRTILILALTAAIGCSGMGSVGDSQRDAAGAMLLLIDSAAQTTFDLCRNAQPGGECGPNAAISTDEKNRIRDTLLDALYYVRLSRELELAGDAGDARAQLEEARRLLQGVEAIIESEQVQP